MSATATQSGVMDFERTTDYELIKQIVTHPKVYPYVSDDYSPAPKEWRPIESEAIWYVLVKDGEELLGLWTLIPQNAVCWEIHTTLLPNAWGDKGKQAARELADWVWQNTSCLRVITNVPEYNRLALKFAKEAGLETFGLNCKSYMKTGILHDQIMLGVSKPCR